MFTSKNKNINYMYTSTNPIQFNFLKEGCNWVGITRACLHGNRSFRTQVNSYPSHFVSFWSLRTLSLVTSYPVTTISYPGHFVPTLVISYPVQVSRYEMTFQIYFVPTLDISYLGDSYLGYFVKRFCHFVPSLVSSYLVQLGTK